MVDKLLEWLRSLPARFINWWERFSSRQKVAISAITAGVIIAFGILIYVLLQPQYVTIYTAENIQDANVVVELLKGAEIEYVTSEDGLIIQVKREDYTDVTFLMGTNEIYADAYSIDNVTDGGFSMTESDRQRRYIVYLEKLMENTLEAYDFVREATVQLSIPENDGTLLSHNEEASASVMLKLTGTNVCDYETSAAMARFVATALGNETTDNIVIVDTDGKLLFSGADYTSVYGVASSQLTLQQKAAELMQNQVERALIALNEFSNIEVAANVAIDSSYTESTDHQYYVNEGREEGYIAQEDHYEAQNDSGTAGIPGTDSNVETTYVYEYPANSSSYVTEDSISRLPNELITYQESVAGSIIPEESSITVTCLKYNVIREEDVERQGLLDGTTWEDYKYNNNVRVKLEIDADYYAAVANATGVDIDRITILGYTEPFFVDKDGFSMETADVLQIILILLILALLAFVMLRSMKSAKTDDEEAEISIEDILKSSPVEEIEEIGVEDKSEARKIVEKFVEDNPEAAANLLRNWLNEDWE